MHEGITVVLTIMDIFGCNFGIFTSADDGCAKLFIYKMTDDTEGKRVKAPFQKITLYFMFNILLSL